MSAAKIRVQSGPNEATVDGAKTVAEIRSGLSGMFNIPSNATAYLNAAVVTEDTLVSEGNLVFRVPTGEKGA